MTAALPDPWALQRAALVAAREHGLEPISRLALLILVRYADRSGECYPGLDTLAADAGCSERHIARALSALSRARLIERQRRGPGRPGLTRLTLPDLTPASGNELPPVADQRTPDLTPASPETGRRRPARPDTGVSSLENRPENRPEELPPVPQGGRQRDLRAYREQCQRYAEAHFPDLAVKPYSGEGGDSIGAAAVDQALRGGAATSASVSTFVDRHWRRQVAA
jgi:hypothetical protein